MLRHINGNDPLKGTFSTWWLITPSLATGCELGYIEILDWGIIQPVSEKLIYNSILTIFGKYLDFMFYKWKHRRRHNAVNLILKTENGSKNWFCFRMIYFYNTFSTFLRIFLEKNNIYIEYANIIKHKIIIFWQKDKISLSKDTKSSIC